MKMSLKILGLTLILWTFLAVSVYATETDNTETEKPVLVVEDLLAQLDTTMDDLAFNDVDLRLRLGIDDVLELDYNQFGSFRFSKGFNQLKVKTFSCEKTLVGQGLANTEVAVLVYTVDDMMMYEGVYEPVRNVTYVSYKKLGASGLYTETVRFEPCTTQYLSVIVRDDSTTIRRTYRITTIEEETKVILENITIDFIKEAPSEPNNTGTESFKTWFGLEQELEF